MRIRGKLSLVSLITILGALIAFSGLLGGTFIYASIKSVESQSLRTIAAWNRLNASTKNLLLEKKPIEDLKREMSDNIDRFDRELQDLMDQADSRWLPERYCDTIDRIYNNWDTSRRYYDEAGNMITSMLAKGLGDAIAEKGVMVYYASIMNSQGDEAVNGLYEIKKLLENSVTINATNETVNELITQLNRNMAEYVNLLFSRIITVSLAIFAGFAVLATVISLRYSRRMARRIQGIEKTMRALADKNLTVRTAPVSKDEITFLSRDINHVISSLQRFIQTAQGASDSVTSLKNQISAGTNRSEDSLNSISERIEVMKEQFDLLNKDIANSSTAVSHIGRSIGELSQRIENQSQSVANTTSSVEQITASVNNVARLTEEQTRNTNELEEVVRTGGEEVENTRTIIESIAKEISNILSIIEIINNVSEQTNLLSMNAAIESAHAGEAGKGFSVVADEIRKLADQTAEYSTQVDNSLKSVTDKIQDALKASNSSSSSFENINQSIHTYASAFAEIASSMEELTQGSQLVLKETGEVSEGTDFIRSGSHSIREETEQVQRSMKELKTVSQSVIQCINDIDAGSAEILELMGDINDLTEESRDRMGNLETVMKGFITE